MIRPPGKGLSRSIPDLNHLPADEAQRARERLAKFNLACGCEAGAIVGFGSLALYIVGLLIGPWRTEGGSMTAFAIGIGVFIIGTCTGKILGLARVKIQRDRFLDELEGRLAREGGNR